MLIQTYISVMSSMLFNFRFTVLWYLLLLHNFFQETCNSLLKKYFISKYDQVYFLAISTYVYDEYNQILWYNTLKFLKESLNGKI